MQLNMTVTPLDAIRELKALKLEIKDKLVYIQSPASKDALSVEARANFAVLYMRRIAALKLIIHAAEEVHGRHLSRAA